MRSKHLKQFLFALIFLIFIVSNIFIFTCFRYSLAPSNQNSILSNPNDQNELDLHSSAPIISTIVIRPNYSLLNNGFDIISESSIHAAIDDNVVAPVSDGDTDYIEGDDFPEYCEVQMGPNPLLSNQKVISIKIYARGRQAGTPGIVNLYVSFSWRIGNWALSDSETLRFEGFSFYWQSTNSWNNLDLSQQDLNDLRIRMSIINSQTDRLQDISVMYAELTVRTNRDPSVNVIAPTEGEDLQDQTTIEWIYSDLDEESVFFNISYDFGNFIWFPIISSLVNETSYLWDFDGISKTNHTVRVRVTGFDANGGIDYSISSNFTVRINRDPSINLISPVGGEILRNQAEIQWNYSDPDEETLLFNISYDLGDNNWILIVSGLVNTTFYSWNLSSFTETQSVVRIRIECRDGYGGFATNISAAYFSIRVGNEINDMEFLIRVISIGSIVGVSGFLVVGVIYRKKKKKGDSLDKISKKPNPYTSGTQSLVSEKNGSKKIIIEADIIVKKGEKYSEKDLLSRFLSQGNLSNKLENDDQYEVVKVIGKINITTLSEDFWEKIDHFEWEKGDKEEFINDMLALPTDCREQFLNEMLERFNGG